MKKKPIYEEEEEDEEMDEEEESEEEEEEAPKMKEKTTFPIEKKPTENYEQKYNELLEKAELVQTKVLLSQDSEFRYHLLNLLQALVDELKKINKG